MKNIFIHYHICNIQIFSSNSKKKNLENENEIYFRYYGYSINVDEYNLIFQLSLNGSLRDVLCSRLLNNDNELKMILENISNGVEYLHNDYREKNFNRSPIAHRDLKTDHILYLNQNRLLICDFAMAIQLDQNQNSPNQQAQVFFRRIFILK